MSNDSISLIDLSMFQHSPFLSSLSFEDRSYWYEQAKGQIRKNLADRRKYNVAENIILFVGDGMGLSTVTASRILKGQRKGQSGEDADLVFDKFSHVALSKTYNIDSQVGDSAACATALMCGVKGRFETLGLDDKGDYDRCDSTFTSRVDCLTDWAQQSGKATGFVTTTRVTHATPGALYAHAASRYWESDEKLPTYAKRSCKDIARQLVEDDPGRNINVILGGGRRHFLPETERDPEYPGQFGRRTDGRNLIDDWLASKKSRGQTAEFVWKKEDFDKINTENTDYLLGLFEHGHMAYVDTRNDGPSGEPSLAEMTTKALDILQKNHYGFFLMVEGGRIDHSHHFSNAKRALQETLAFEEAIIAAIAKVNPENTLMVVTADHSHVFTFGGYPKRGNPIFGLDSKLSDIDNMPYTTLLYGNGPGYDHRYPGGRQNVTNMNTDDINYIQQSAVPRRWETHGGEDVPVYAHGTMSHLFRGVIEQTYIPHALAYAACIGPYMNQCQRTFEDPSELLKLCSPQYHNDIRYNSVKFRHYNNRVNNCNRNIINYHNLIIFSTLSLLIYL
ncbi:ALPL (predicted) [Pycnogonum litorale]